MRVLTYMLSIQLIVVTSFNIRTLGNSVDNPANKENEPHHLVIERLLHEIEDELRDHVLGEDVKHPVEREEREKTSENTATNSVEADIAMHINQHGLNYVAHHLMSSIRHDVLRHPTMSLKTAYLGMDLSLDAVQVIHFHPPALHFEAKGSTLRVTTKGGQAKLLGMYSAVYKTQREGQLAATIEDLFIELELDLENGNLTDEDVVCSHSLGVVNMELQPAMPSQITDQLRDSIIEHIGSKICPTARDFARKVVKVARTAVSINEPSEKTTEPTSYHLQYSRRSQSESHGLTVSFEKNHRVNHATVTLPAEHSQMGAVVISQTYINEFLTDFVNDRDVKFQMHRIPEIEKALLLSCEADSDCLGNFVHLKNARDGSAHLESQLRSVPTVQMKDDHADLTIEVLNRLSFQNKDDEQRVEYLTYRTRLVLRVKEIQIEPATEAGTYQWKAQYEILEISNTDIESHDDELLSVVQHLDLLMHHKTSELETLISTYLDGTLPISINSHIHLVDARMRFQHGQMTIFTDFKMNRRLFPFFSFIN